MDDVTIYSTPAPETPYATPAGTPHRITYRMNPVRLVRQHVPLKIQASESVGSPPVEKEKDGPNSGAGINPMKTKRAKCVIQLTSVVPTGGVGDQHVVPAVTSQQMSIKSTPTDMNSECLRQIIQPSQYHTPKNCEQETLCNSRGDAGSIDRTTSNSCGDNRATKIPIPTNNPLFLSNNVESTDLSMPKVIERVAHVEKEVDTVRSENTDELKDDKAAGTDAKEMLGKLKKDGKRSILTKKSVISNSDHANPPVGHGCDKKKFYDPQDIRKYMMKKKNERKAKEKEEKSKKASEQAAVKRKVDVTKPISIRPKFPSYRGQEQSQNQITTTSDKSRTSKKFKNSKADGKSVSDENIQVTMKRMADNVAISKSRSSTCDNTVGQSSLPTMTQFRHSPDTYESNDVEKARMYADTEVLATGVRLYSPDIGSQRLSSGSDSDGILADEFQEKRTAKVFQPTVDLPSEVNVLKYKNPYNFLDILKVKMNLARKADNVLLESHDTAVPSTPLNQIGKAKGSGSKQHIINDLMEKRQRLENLHMEVDTRNSLLLKPELTLSDLNLSPEKKEETFVICGENEVGDKTFVVADKGCDLKRKFASKQFDREELKENHNVFEMSGVRSLACSKGTAPLSENNVITNTMESESSYSDQKYPILASKSHNSRRLITDQLDKEDQPLKRRSDTGAAKTLNTNLMKVSSLESLKAPNVSLMLSHPLKRSLDSATPRSASFRTPLMEDFHSTLVATDCGKSQLLGINGAALNDTSATGAVDDYTIASSTTLLADLYDQMINNEEEKLSQILTKIQKQKESLNKLLRSEVFALETQKK